MSFAEIANQRLLRSVADHLGELTWDVDPDGYQRLKVPPDASVDVLLRLLLRRGLEPALASMLLDRFESRPLERALVAWDIAAGSLLGRDDAELAQRLRADLAPLKQLGATPSVAVPYDRVAALIETAVSIGESPNRDAQPPSLAALAASSASDTATIAGALAFAERLAVAHLPSLALAIAQILWARHWIPAALDRIVETGLDYERFESMPIMAEEDERSIQRQTYFNVRAALAQLDTDSAATILAQMSKHPAVASSSDPALNAARAELDLLSDKPVERSSVSALEAIAPDGSTWIYGSRVRDELRIEIAPQNAALVVDGFVSSFGNNMRVWAQAGYHEEVRAEVLALVSREVRYQSHDPEVWRALAVFLDDASQVEVELQARSAAQLAAALA